MEKKAKILDDILNAFQETDGCLEKLTDLLDDYPLDTEEDGYSMDESDCPRLCLDFKRACLMLEEIQLDLSEIAKYYNKSFTTDYPLIFQKFIEEHQKVMTESALQMLDGICQMAAPDGENQPTAPSPEVEKPTILSPEVEKLCQMVAAMRRLLSDILSLCQRTKTQEERTRKKPKKCLEMLERACQEARANQEGVIQMYLQMGASQMPATPRHGKPLMSQVMKEHGSLEEFAAAHFHEFSMSDIHLYVVEKALTEHRLQGLTEEEAEWWREEPQMARDVRYVIEHFDELDVESKKGGKDGTSEKRLISPMAISMLMQWSHASRATSCISVPRFFRYFRSIYKGELQLPSESNYHKYKGKFTEQMYQEFLLKIEQQLQKRERKAVEVELKAQ